MTAQTIQNQDQASESPAQSDRTRHSQRSGAFTSSKHSEEMKRMVEAIKDLQRELASRSRRSSLASPSRAESRMEIRETGEFEERQLRQELSSLKEMEVPRRRTWAEMTEIQGGGEGARTRGGVVQPSPKRVLESALQESRRDRLTQAGLGSPRTGLASSENTAIY